MNLADVFTFLFVILGFVIVYVAYWLATAGLFPSLTERCAERLARSPIKATVVGLVVWLPVLFIGTTISSKAPIAFFKFCGVILMILSTLVALAGSSGLAARVGAGLPAARDAQEPWRRVLRGGTILALTFVLPFIGWLVMVWAFVAGFGAVIMGRPKPDALPVAEPAPASLSAAEPATP